MKLKEWRDRSGRVVFGSLTRRDTFPPDRERKKNQETIIEKEHVSEMKQQSHFHKDGHCLENCCNDIQALSPARGTMASSI